MKIPISRRFIFVLLILLNTATPGSGQTVTFRKYTDTVNRFSRSLASQWRMRYSENRFALACVPASKERPAYEPVSIIKMSAG